MYQNVLVTTTLDNGNALHSSLTQNLIGRGEIFGNLRIVGLEAKEIV